MASKPKQPVSCENEETSSPEHEESSPDETTLSEDEESSPDETTSTKCKCFC